MDIEATAEFRQRLRGRQSLFGGWTSIGHHQIADAFATAGLDFIGIDIEHSTISLEQSLAIIATCQAADTICLPRIASHNAEMIKRLLDSGADGVIVPMVSTPAEVENIIAWTKYPPRGRRSFGVARAQRYGLDFQTYAQRWNGASSIIIQIETVEGVENIERLLAYDEIDGAMVGPYDLSGSLGIPGQIDSPKVQEAARHVNDACRKLGRACGTHLIEPTSAGIAKAFADGFSFVVLSSDVFLLAQWSRTTRRQIAEIRGSGR